MQTSAPDLERQIGHHRAAFAALRAKLEQALTPYFMDPADAADALLTNADAYGSQGAIAKLARSLTIIAEPALGARAADPGTLQRARLLLADLIAEHEAIDTLNARSPAVIVDPIHDRIFIQGEAFAIDKHGVVEARPELAPQPILMPDLEPAEPEPEPEPDDEEEEGYGPRR